MSRVASNPVLVPSGVDVNISGKKITIKGGKGTLEREVHDSVDFKLEDGALSFAGRAGAANASAFAGTMRSLVNAMVIGVSEGFQKKLQLVGVGYRAQAKGKTLSLSLGFSHPVEFKVPEGITVETPSNTEVVVNGADKQLVGQVAANIRAYRPPEPYKGKGVRYANEHIRRKEAKKK